jgi:hypothetical protein
MIEEPPIDHERLLESEPEELRTPPEPEPEQRVVPAQVRNGSRPPDTHVLLPQSADAEMAVLCSILHHPREVIAYLIEKRGLRAHHFHLPHHRTIFDGCRYLNDERLFNNDGYDLIVLTQFLADDKTLDQCGGAAGLTEISQFIGTAANVAQYADTMLEKHARREMIRRGEQMATRARDELATVAGLIEDTQLGLETLGAELGRNSLAEMLAGRRFDSAHPPPEPAAVVSLGGVVIATPENLMMIQAKVKAGKTAALGGLLASTMARDGGDCLGFESDNPHGWAVLHFDTEQSRFDHHKVIARALRRAGREVPPAWFRSYYLKGLPPDQIMSAVRQQLAAGKKECGGVLLAVIDGIGDCCVDVNDPAEAFMLVSSLEALAVEYATVIVCVLHENPGSEIGKTRGHLGSQLERKAETPLRLEKDAEGVTVMYSERARSAHITKDQGPRFAWSGEQGMHVSVEKTAATKTSAKQDRLHALAEKIFENVPDAVGLTWEQLHRRIEEIDGVGRSGARKKYDSLMDIKAIRKNGDKYRLA